jgi:hypothetical protein
MFPHFGLKRAGTPPTADGDTMNSIRKFKPHFPHRHHQGPTRRQRFRVWTSTPWGDPNDLGLPDW